MVVPGLQVRQVAIRLLASIIEKGMPLDGLLDSENGNKAYRQLEDRDQALCRTLLIKALRHRGHMETLLHYFLHTPLPKKATTLHHLLHISMAQILYLNIPVHAAIHLGVEAAKRDPRCRRFAPLVNALLRKVARSSAEDSPSANDPTPSVYAQNAPAWFWQKLCDAYGVQKAQTIMALVQKEGPLDFTVKENPQAWAHRLGGIVLPNGSVRIPRSTLPIDRLPGFLEGAWWIQNAAAALPATLFGPLKGRMVADLCAAPGGKTAQLVLQGAKVTAFDISATRLKRLKSNMDRLALPCETVCTDLRTYEPETLFDAVLLDAPCSATGTLRRHPDILWTKTVEDVEKLAKIQKSLLEKAIKLTKPGGTIIFSNCSLMKEEGEQLMCTFLAEHEEVRLWPLTPLEYPPLKELLTAEGFLRTTPSDWPQPNPLLSGLDGFFAARLQKRKPV